MSQAFQHLVIKTITATRCGINHLVSVQLGSYLAILLWWHHKERFEWKALCKWFIVLKCHLSRNYSRFSAPGRKWSEFLMRLYVPTIRELHSYYTMYVCTALVTYLVEGGFTKALMEASDQITTNSVNESEAPEFKVAHAERESKYVQLRPEGCT